MEAKNLRVTNLVYNDRIVNAVIFIGFDSVQLITPQENNITARLDLIKPIPLTEEWLIKLGFIKVGINYEKDWLALWENKTTGTVDFVINEPYSGKRHITALKYVHELQNLFFAISGNELEYKRQK